MNGLVEAEVAARSRPAWGRSTTMTNQPPRVRRPDRDGGTHTGPFGRGRPAGGTSKGRETPCAQAGRQKNRRPARTSVQARPSLGGTRIVAFRSPKRCGSNRYRDRLRRTASRGARSGRGGRARSSATACGQARDSAPVSQVPLFLRLMRFIQACNVETN